MKKIVYSIFAISLILALTLPIPLSTVSAADPITFTILHTNDFHGNLEPSGSNPGAARVADVINDVRTAVGPSDVLVMDAGDIMQGSLANPGFIVKLSNLSTQSQISLKWLVIALPSDLL